MESEEVCYAGLDPGIHGWLAISHPDGDLGLTPLPYGGNALDFRRWMGEAFLLPEGTRCTVERQFSLGKGGNTIYKNYGALLAGLCAAGIEFEEVSPAVWKKWWGLSKDKDASLVKALEEFGDEWELDPDELTHDAAEALLLLEYGRSVVWKAT